jgi:hypothetical protein
MQSTVVMVDLQEGMVAVETKGGRYTVFELLGFYEVSIGDVISSAFDSLDERRLRNETRGEDIVVYMRALNVTLFDVKRLMN